MAYFALGAIALIGLLGIIRVFTAADPRTLVRLLRYGVGGTLVAIGVLLVFVRRFGFGVPLILFGVAALRTGQIAGFDLGGGSRRGGGASRVRSAYLDMELEHDSGELAGRVHAGAFAGRSISELSEEELRRLHAEVASDADSLTLVEAYLDRRMPGWREHFQDDVAGGAARPAGSGAMTQEEAYQVLGLAAGASEAEIRSAHRRLMKGVHPDQGGSTFLAAKLNEAKDRLLGKHH